MTDMNKDGQQTEGEISKREKKLEKREQKINEPNKLFGELTSLEHAVAITRHNRINAANRLTGTEDFLQGINIYYSCFSAILAVLSLLSSKTEIAVWSTLLSIILAISIVYLNAQKYGSRAQEFKTNYIALHELLFDIQREIAEYRAEENLATEKMNELQAQYCKLLQTSENHINLDYLKQKWHYDYKHMNSSEKLEYIFILSYRIGFKVLLIAFPILVMVLMLVRGTLSGLL